MGTASLSFERLPPSLVVVVVVVVLLLRKQLQLGWNRPASNLWGSPPAPREPHAVVEQAHGRHFSLHGVAELWSASGKGGKGPWAHGQRLPGNYLHRRVLAPSSPPRLLHLHAGQIDLPHRCVGGL